MYQPTLVNKRKLYVNDKITVHIPTLKEIQGDSVVSNGNDEDENKYWELVNLFVATSTDMMVQLDDAGKDFTTVTDYSIFLSLFNSTDKSLLREKSWLLFDNINLADFEVSINRGNNQIVLYDPTHEVVIDELLYMRLSTIFCTINNIKKNHRKMGNETARKYVIERERLKQKRRRSRHNDQIGSRFDKQIIALVNNQNFKYNYETVKELTVYNFLMSFKQIAHKYNVDNLNIGVFTGNIKFGDVKNKLDWTEFDNK